MNKHALLSFVREMIIVIMGILIALSINTWNEHRKDRAYINTALNAIEKEIQFNQTNLRDILKRHELTRDSIQAHLQDDSTSVEQFFHHIGGFQVAFTQDVAFRYFVSNRTNLIDFEVISLLSKIESMDHVLAKKVDKFINLLYDHMESTKAQDKRKLLVYLNEIIESENGLMALYNAFLSRKPPPHN
ncbi:MAG: hypothetical protein D6715_06095 [Calditrichaeota bacterium]|nr:MAG: hypothetical protein D6715_06095 [Calditrichota bacterium]